jgi:potassium/sodium efflux P-type ATPase
MREMVKRHALIRRLASVETLGSATIICSDKTGTLTQNEMTVREVYLFGTKLTVSGIGYEPEGDFRDGAGNALTDDQRRLLEELLEAGVLCNNSELRPPEDDRGWDIRGDPTEGALVVLAAKESRELAEARERMQRLRENPFDSERKMMSVIYEDQGTDIAYVKGAPREVLEKCSQMAYPGGVRPLGEDDRGKIMEQNDAYALAALRVLAVATRRLENASITEMGAEQVEHDLTFLGLVAMQDPPRPEVEQAIRQCATAGIRVIMITGDYGLTAEAIARRIGLITEKGVRTVTGADLDGMTDEQLQEALRQPVLFARVAPEQKMKIARALQEMDEIVAMTGDGVNDAPALKTADIGVAMGITGTDVAREAADMILTDDNFASIVNAIEEGRSIFDNIRHFLTYFQTSNVAEMVPFLAMIFFNIPLPLLLLQILTIDLVTDQVPALALGLERPEPGIMERPPRKRAEPLLNGNMIMKAYLFLGPLAAAIGLFGFFFRYHEYGWRLGLDLRSFGTDKPASVQYLAATTMTLTGIVMAQVGNGFACRTQRESVFRVGFFTNRLLLAAILLELGLQAVIVYAPFLHDALKTRPISAKDWAILMAFIPTLFIADEIRKLIVRTRYRKKGEEKEDAG